MGIAKPEGGDAPASSREAAEAAWNELEAEQPESNAAPEPVEPEVDDAPPEVPVNDDRETADNQDTEARPERLRGPDGKFLKQEEGQGKKEASSLTKDAAKTTPDQDAAKVGTKEGTTPKEKPADVPGNEIRPPASMTPAEQEAFNKAPPELKKFFARREYESKRRIDAAAESERFTQTFQQALGRHVPMFQQAGVHPLKGLSDLADQAALMRTGQPQQKAALVASWVQQFQIPPDLIADALEGKGQPVPQPQQPQQPAFDPDAITQMVEQRFAQREVSSWAQGKEFLEVPGLRDTAADLIEMAARRNQVLSLDDAYQQACKLHPEVSATLAKREAEKAEKERQASTLKARAASSSVRGSPTGVSTTPNRQNRNGRDAAEAAWDEVVGR